jgi:hypothetical protein
MNKQDKMRICGEYPRRPVAAFGFEGDLLPVDLACRDTLHELPSEHVASEFLRTWVEYASTNLENADTAWMEADNMGLADELVELGGFDVFEDDAVVIDILSCVSPTDLDDIDDIDFVDGGLDDDIDF